MYWGLVGVSAIAFSCSTEFVPEINEKLRLVPFTYGFKVMLTTTMVADFVVCWGIEKGLKWAFSDFRPKDIAVRRLDQDEREKAREEVERKEAEREATEKAAIQAREVAEKAAIQAREVQERVKRFVGGRGGKR